MMILLWIAVIAQNIVLGGLTLDVDQECWSEVGYCMGISETNKTNTGIPQWQARSECIDRNQVLLEIRSSDIQAHANQLASHIPDESTSAWIGARRKRGDGLQTLTGEDNGINGMAIMKRDKRDRNCVTAKKSGSKVDFIMENCDENTGNHLVICQLDIVQESCANMYNSYPTIPVNDSCYMIAHRPNPNNNQKDPDWFSSQSLCQNLSGINARLVVTLDDSALLQMMEDGESMWMGYWRKPWTWNFDGTMRYFHWKPHSGDSSDLDCSVIQKNGFWKEEGCEEFRHYFLCYNGTTTSSTPIHTRTSISTTTATTTTSMLSLEMTGTTRATTELSGGGHPREETETTALTKTHSVTDQTLDGPSTSVLDESQGGQHESQGTPEGLPIYAGAAAGGVVLLVVIVIVVVCVVRKRNKEDTKSHDYANHPQSSPRPQTPSNDQQYEMVPDNFMTPPSSSDLDIIAPYAEFGGVAHPGSEPAAGATDPNYDVAVAVRGDYPEQDRVRGTSDVANDVTGEGGDAVQEAPPGSDVYASVNKPKPETEDMEDVVVDNALYGEM